MNYRTLGKDLTVSTVGLVCMGMTHAYGPPAPEAKMKQLLHQAIGLGYTFFDTAECYTGKREDGSTAYNEELLGAALKPYRSKIVIATKFGVQHSALGIKTDSRPETIRKSVEGSLRRLDTDYIDLYYQHRIDPKVPVEDVAGIGHIYSFYGRLSVGSTDVEKFRESDLPPTFYAYGTEDPFYRQFMTNADAVREAGVEVEEHCYDGQPHGFGAGTKESNWTPEFDRWFGDICENN